MDLTKLLRLEVKFLTPNTGSNCSYGGLSGSYVLIKKPHELFVFTEFSGKPFEFVDVFKCSHIFSCP